VSNVTGSRIPRNCLHVDARHDAEIAVVDLLVVVVLDLHDLVAWTEGPTEPVDEVMAGQLKRLVQFNLERSGYAMRRNFSALPAICC